MIGPWRKPVRRNRTDWMRSPVCADAPPTPIPGAWGDCWGVSLFRMCERTRILEFSVD